MAAREPQIILKTDQRTIPAKEARSVTMKA
jgi:hypothetical protein